MQNLRALPVVHSLLEKGQYKQAILIVQDYIDVLTPYIDFKFPDPAEIDEETCFSICKIFLYKKEYSKAISYGLRARTLLKHMDDFLFQSFVFRAMDELYARVENGINNDFTSQIKEFVLSHIASESYSDAVLGYLAHIKEFDLLSQKLKEISLTDIDCKEILSILYQKYPVQLREILCECEVQNSSFFEFVIDSYVLNKTDDEVKAFVNSLPWQQKYTACLYLEDTHNLPLEMDDEKCNQILDGTWKNELLSTYLVKNNKTNFKILETMAKSRAPYMALVNSFMNLGTTNDSLYRNNKSLINGKEWTRFMEFASLGMIHKDSNDPFEILKELLPSVESSSGEAGALMALGLMTAGKNDRDVIDYFTLLLNSESNEIVFGACIGLGLCALETGRVDLFEKLKHFFHEDNSIMHESALYAIGLIFASIDDAQVVVDFIKSIHDTTDFPRVKRVCGLATALIYSLNEKEVEPEKYLQSTDASVRAMGLLSLGSAYVATSNFDIIEKVLPFVNDGDDETKKAAVIALSLIGYDDYEVTSYCIMPLAENHNPFVRATAALCLGFFHSGICNAEIGNILEALLYDSDDLVKQSAAIGVGFAMAQSNPTLSTNYKRIMDRLNYIIVNRGESQCVKIGASLGRGIAETSGRSAVFSLKNLGGQVITSRVAGAMMFLFSWYWYPLMPCVSLCHLPTPLFFFDQNLEETDDFLMNSEIYYDYIVKLPEIKKSRKFKPNKSQESTKDITENAKEKLRSGDRLPYKEKLFKDLGTGFFFKER